VSGGSITIAVVGIGRFARDCVLPAAEQVSSVECTVLVTGDPSAVTDPTRTVIEYEAFHDGVAADEYDAVYVATPNHTHRRFVETAIALGKDVLCEKPMAGSVEDARAIADRCSEADVTLMLGNRVQFKPTIRYVRELIREGLLGTPVHVHSDTSFEVLDRDGPDQWRLDPAKGGGALLDIGVYSLNTIRFLLGGTVTPQSASVRTTERIPNVDAHASFTLELSAGGTAVCTASFAAHPASQIRLVGTDAVVDIEAAFRPFVEPTVTVSKGTDHWTLDAERCNEYEEQLAYFAQCLLREEHPEPDAVEGVADVETIADIKTLASEG
jgi:xylose dehydrogenase (NAD/NADP)